MLFLLNFVFATVLFWTVKRFWLASLLSLLVMPLIVIGIIGFRFYDSGGRFFACSVIACVNTLFAAALSCGIAMLMFLIMKRITGRKTLS